MKLRFKNNSFTNSDYIYVVLENLPMIAKKNSNKF